MKGLKTLILMQLKDKLDLSFIKSKKQTIFKVVLSLLKFVVFSALIYLAFYVVNYLGLVSPNRIPGIPQNFFVFVFSVMFMLSVLVCTVGLVKSLYMAKDNSVLLVLPVGRTTVFTSKLIVYYIYELIRNLSYFLPLFIAYSLINKLPLAFYLWLIPAYFILTALPVVIGALISIPAVYVTNFVRQYHTLQIILIIAFLLAIVAAVVFLINLIPTNFDLIGTWGTTIWQIVNFLNRFGQIFKWLGYVVIMVVGERIGVTNKFFHLKQIILIFGFIAVIAAIFAITYLIVRPLFYKMASSPFEYKKVKVVKPIKNKKHNAFISAVKKEVLLTLRTQEKIYGLLTVVIGMPISILLLNRIYAAMDTRLSGLNMSVAFNILIILLFALSSNCNFAHIYSEEGASSYLIKTIPKPNLQCLFAKLTINLVCVSISNLVTVCVFAAFTKYVWWQVLLIYLVVQLIYVSHLLMSAEYDIMNPQTQQYQSTGTHVNNPNDARSSIMSIIISVIIAFITYFLIAENAQTVWIKLLIVAICFFALRVWLYVNKIKVYYKEKC